MHRLILILLSLGLSTQAVLAEVRGKEVSYSDGSITMKGYLAWDDAVQGKRPGVLVVHEWWGHNQYARKRADMLAKMGYTALAVDMYGEGRTASHPKEAGEFAGEVRKNMVAGRARFEAALRTLQQEASVDPGRIAALGYCFGGTVVLEMARQGLDLDGVASYHGNLATSTPAEPGKFKAKVAVFTGEADPMIPAAQVEAFRKEMEQAGVAYRLTSYPGVKHSFTNPEADDYGQRFGIPLAYDKHADQDSWAQTGVFLRDVFK